ncbi:MAG: sigma-70 family RNA polymerase sigma factor [Candidatus Korobacteraceae bacterium]|jgi:RNA polymerase sigma-70 factor (ECF subfamily)
MFNGVQREKYTELAAAYVTELETMESYQAIYARNQHRVYALAFWMTDNELEAEQVMEKAFLRVFSISSSPSEEMVDCALLDEIRQLVPVGVLTLKQDACSDVLSVRRNVKRVDLERAVVKLPATERLIYLLHDGDGYDHERIASTLGITEDDSRYGLHQARLGLRALLAA